MGMLNDKGSVTVLFVGLMPVFVVFLLFMLSAGTLFFHRERLQIAADRAAFAGAASLAYDLNRIAEFNWELAREYRELRRKFSGDAEAERRGEEELQASIAFQQDREADIFEVMQEIFARAEQKAQQVFAENVPHADAEIVATPGRNVIDCFQDPETGAFLRRHLSYDTVKGFIFDPVEAREDAGGGDLVEYCAKDPDAKMAVIVDALEVTPSPFLPSWFGLTWLEARAVAQPYGGSLKEIAMTEAHSFHEVTAYDQTYRPTLVP